MPPSLKKPLELWHLILAVVVPIVGFLLLAGQTYANFANNDRRHDETDLRQEKRLDDQDLEIRDMSQKLNETSTDVKWLREYFDPKR